MWSEEGLIASTSEVFHIIRQLKSLPEALANFPTLTLGPVPYSGGCKKGIIPKHKGGLPPSSRRRGGGSHVKPNLYSWASIVNRLSDHHGSRGRSWRSLFRPSRGLVCMVKSFAITGGWRRLFPVLGCCCCAVGRPPGINRSSVIVLWTTISSSGFLASALVESTYLTSTCSTVGALVRYSSIGICTSWP